MALDFRVVFESVPGLYLVLTPDLTIVAASDAYLRATKTKREEVLGRGLFEVFPDNPDDPAASGVSNTRASMDRVRQSHAPDAMAVQRHDIHRPESEGGGFEEKFWSPANSPVLDPAGEITWIIHRVEDVTELVRLKHVGAEQQRLSEERLDLALESAQMGAWDLDLVHDTAVRSLRHDQIFGYSSLLPAWGSEVFLAHVLPEDRELVRKRFGEAFATGQLDMECRILWPDQSVHWIAAQGHVYYSEKKVPVRMLGVVRDVSEQKRAEKALFERSAQLEAANHELEAFAYSVSHDLRAPLRAIDGFSQVLLEDEGEKLGDSGRDALGRVRAAAARMAQLIDDMLKLSRVTRTELQRTRVDLSEAARSVASELVRREPGRLVEIRIADGVLAEGDAPLLRLVLENLLGNSFKFTSKAKEALIEFGIERQNDEPVYYVRDNGAGFDAAFAGKLFGAFQRLHSEAEFPGTGIGLATVQRIIHRHGGRVWAKGAVDGGATFRFTL